MAAGIETQKRGRIWLKNLFQTALLVMLVSLGADWWRKPAQPVVFEAQPLMLLDGRQADWADIGRQRTAVVYFWAEWCGFCRHTSPAVQRLHKAGVPVLGIALKSGGSAEVQNYMRRHGWDFDTANDADGSISARWQIRATPTVVLVRNGKMIHSTTGLSSYWGLRGRVWLADVLGWSGAD